MTTNTNVADWNVGGVTAHLNLPMPHPMTLSLAQGGIGRRGDVARVGHALKMIDAAIQARIAKDAAQDQDIATATTQAAQALTAAQNAVAAAQQSVQNLIGTAPTAFDTWAEIVSSIQNEQSATSAIMQQLGTLATAVSSVQADAVLKSATALQALSGTLRVPSLQVSGGLRPSFGLAAGTDAEVLHVGRGAAGTARWQLRITATEDLIWYSYNNDGTHRGTPLTLTRDGRAMFRASGVSAVDAETGGAHAITARSLSAAHAGVVGFNHNFTAYGMLGYASHSIYGLGPLRNDGVIQSAAGGFQFPDSTVQTTAAVQRVAGFVCFNGATGAIKSSSGNIASVTRNGVGLYTINFSNNFGHTNYGVVPGMQGYADNGSTFAGNIGISRAANAKTGTSVQIAAAWNNGTALDAVEITVAIFGA
jgi:hypothetical protein